MVGSCTKRPGCVERVVLLRAPELVFGVSGGPFEQQCSAEHLVGRRRKV
jgi:hypothetical protein